MDDFEKKRIEDILNKIEEQFINGKINEESYKNLIEKYHSKLKDSEPEKVESKSRALRENSDIIGESPKQEYGSRRPEKKSSGVAAIASFFIPGLGQIYNGQILKGILFIIFCGLSVLIGIFLVGAGAFALLITGKVFAASPIIIIGIILYPIFWVYNIYDAYNTAERTHL